MENTKISKLSIAELDQVIKVYPWFSLARKELFFKMTLLGEECREEGLKKVVPYVFSPRHIIRERKSVLNQKIKVEKPTFSFSSPVEVFKPQSKKPKIQKQIHVIGGDYFQKEDFSLLEEDGLTVVDRIKLNNDAPREQIYQLEPMEEEFVDSKYYTETLAVIYTNQGFYEKAIDVYNKLILLYPKKNAYFASLIGDLKKYL